MDKPIYDLRAGEDRALPIELYTPEQLAGYARNFAGAYAVAEGTKGNYLLDRLNDNEQILREYTHRTLVRKNTPSRVPASQWLIDNYYLAEEQVQLARSHLPKEYSRGLPAYKDGPYGGLPRVYGIVFEYVRHVDAELDIHTLKLFIDAYQEVSELQLGELWAIPIMLRLSLIEILRRIASNLRDEEYQRELAREWIEKIKDAAAGRPSAIIGIIAEMSHEKIPLSSAFVSEFSQGLSAQNVLHGVRAWMEQRLSEDGVSVEEMMQAESHAQAADQLTVTHCINSLRELMSTDWRLVVEDLSVVERILRTDPAGVYPLMDFATRDRYRHQVEGLAKCSGLTEPEIASRVTARAAEACLRDPDARDCHVGYYLIDEGREAFAAGLGAKRPMRERVRAGLLSHPLAFYCGGILLLTIIAGALFGLWLSSMGIFPGGWRAVTVISVFTFFASQLAVDIMNWLSPLMVKPEILPRMDFSRAVPPEQRTMVVIPTIISDTASVGELLERLELHYLSNTGRNLHFALLTDFPDASQETLPRDGEVTAAAVGGIERLNRKYGSEDYSIFYLFHRPRKWNPREGAWMGHERKRGKLIDFTRYLRGGARDRFSVVYGNPAVLEGVRYVITLDTDTQLPGGSACKMIGAMAHPLNRPEYEPGLGTVAKGYGILQPRVSINLVSSRCSAYSRIFSADAGIDPYTRAVSDVYQDVFREGSFTGKGIYDVDTFNKVLSGRFPDDKILSHDLLESTYMRSGLLSDVEVYESCPAGYDTECARRHRWIRGDWQLLQWLLPRVPAKDGHKVPNPVSALGKWKLFDNLRRSLIPPATLLFLLLAAILIPSTAAKAALLVLALTFVPPLLNFLTGLVRKTEPKTWRLVQKENLRSLFRQAGQVLLYLTLLPYEAYLNLSAIFITIWRLAVSHKHLLQWRTSSAVEKNRKETPFDFYTMMWPAPLFALACGGAAWMFDTHFFLLTLPAYIAWILSPLIAWRLSRPAEQVREELSAEQKLLLRRIARKTWAFFDTFVNAGENWLPPDNFQQVPEAVIATRTSPTNIGLSLLANLSGCDFGYIPAGRLIQRTGKCFDTIDALPKHRGHLYNWYHTRTLEPLHPHYISTVDSGNLAGHLITLGEGLKELITAPVYRPELFRGLQDTVTVMRESQPENDSLCKLEQLCSQAPDDIPGALKLLREIKSTAQSVTGSNETDIWLKVLLRSIDDASRELLWFWPGDTTGYGSLPESLSATISQIAKGTSLYGLARMETRLSAEINKHRKDLTNEGIQQLESTLTGIRTAAKRARERIRVITSLVRRCNGFAAGMDFTFLYEPARKLFTIGYNVSDQRMDNSSYDLLASEARLASYVAIGLGQVPEEHWFSLGRLIMISHGDPVLLSWSGSMFEYLMPLLVMPDYEHTLLGKTYRGAVREQIDYAARLGVPWGISESGYNRKDTLMNYQYKAFGVPSLGLKRGLSEQLVITPYAAVMALMVAPRKSYDNMRALAEAGYEGFYGFYEAVDYTPSHLQPGQTSEVIRSFMAHHQGMSLLSLGNVLGGDRMQRRFMSSPRMKACELLLQERIPRNVAVNVISDDSEYELEGIHPLFPEEPGSIRRFGDMDIAPEVNLLSNGSYHVMVNHAGSGYSRYNNFAVTRWREDATSDRLGLYIYLREPGDERFDSAAYQPAAGDSRRHTAVFTPSYAEFLHEKTGLDIRTTVCVSPEDDLEIRRVEFSNHTAKDRTIELTTYTEAVISPVGADEAHPAFNNLFVETEFLPDSAALIATRRPRSAEERPLHLFHMMVTAEENAGNTSCETSRNAFVGRGRTLASPLAMERPGSLDGSTGAVLDPSISLRRRVMVPAGEKITVCVILGVASTRKAALKIVGKYQNERMTERAFEMAWTQSHVLLTQLGITETEAQAYNKLAGSLVYSNPQTRSPQAVLKANRRGQDGLWSYGISGDLPIILVRISAAKGIELVRQLVIAHAYWRMKGLAVEIMILNEDSSVYRQSVHDDIINLIASGMEAPYLDSPAGIYVRPIEQVPQEDLDLLQAAARVVLNDKSGPLIKQLEKISLKLNPASPLKPVREPEKYPQSEKPSGKLLFGNGLGGFSPDGKEYIINLKPGDNTPAPWCNVLANPDFGTVISESGSAYSWAVNAHLFRLTPWNNDPVKDASGEAFYIRDEDTGRYWSPCPFPVRGDAHYAIRHGFGYSVFEHTSDGIESQMTVFVARHEPVKFTRIKLRNNSPRPRRLSVTGYYEWVLADQRHRSLLHVQTEADVKTGVVYARNYYNSTFAGRIAFLDVDGKRTFTCDRTEFIGRGKDLSSPRAMERERLSGRTGAGLDPCAAMQINIELPAGGQYELCFRLGSAGDKNQMRELTQRYRGAAAVSEALEEVRDYWQRTLSTVTVRTPDDAVNIMGNGWLLYQTLACRMWARSGFYQSGGAYGFRDQLQDSMALVHAEPALTREQILLAASRQFTEGDVQHWWHPPTGRGVRTQFSDDYLWLPYVTCKYVEAVGDRGILDVEIPFLEGRRLRPDEESYYDLPGWTPETGTLYGHCVRSIRYGLKFGIHGLPLMGCGDWNDGMNLVGIGGRGESVWLAFFLFDVLRKFAPVAESRGDTDFSALCHAEAARLKENINLNAWDGKWYLRAFFDDGQPLGTDAQKECRIDSIPQSWSVISGAGEAERSVTAMKQVDKQLVSRQYGLVRLFTRPFDKSAQNPGYIKGYIPGVRENGGQYTHAAIWTAMAFAEMGETEKAWEIFRLLNPISHGDTPERVDIYKVEPYVLAADVYTNRQHPGRGGWTWYTGSSAWMYRLLTETLLGLNRRGNTLLLQPLLPQKWDSFAADYRFGDTVYHITLRRAAQTEQRSLTVDGIATEEPEILPLIDDRQEHEVIMAL